MTMAPSNRRRLPTGPPVGGWWSPTARRLHLTLAIGFPGCMAAGWFELSRALGGREIAWVYAFEWPLYGLCGIYLWWRLLHAESSTESPVQTIENAEPVSSIARATVDDDPELAAWQLYLKNLHEIDPPGAPPARSQ
jgi:hypothetical protein